MTKIKEPGYYEVGVVEDGRRSGRYGVIRGEVANQNPHEEWSHICEDALKKSKWFSYRIYTENQRWSRQPRTELIDIHGSKSEAIEYIEKYVPEFDEVF